MILPLTLFNSPKCDVIAIVSDEQAYIAEFIHHYLYLKFNNIFLGVNNSSDKTVKVIKKIAKERENIFLINTDKSHKRGQQAQCYQQLFDTAKQLSDSDFALFVDVDEFWIADPFPRTVSDFLKGKQDYDCISFQWILCWNETPFSPPLSNPLNGGNSHVKSMISYKTTPHCICPHAPIYSSKNIVKSLLNGHENLNQLNTKHGIEILQKINCEKLIAFGERNHAWIFHRHQRSELEYVHRLFKPHANDSSVDPIFKNNRNGFRNPKPTRNIGRFCEQLLPVKRVLDYHLSLNRFINKNRVRGLINRATFEMSEDSLWHRIMKINGDKLSKNSALIEKIFQGTRFYSWITNAANNAKNDTID